jgi:hypothetical protein
MGGMKYSADWKIVLALSVPVFVAAMWCGMEYHTTMRTFGCMRLRWLSRLGALVAELFW